MMGDKTQATEAQLPALERGGEDACGHASNIPFRIQDDKNLNLIFKIKF